MFFEKNKKDGIWPGGKRSHLFCPGQGGMEPVQGIENPEDQLQDVIVQDDGVQRSPAHKIAVQNYGTPKLWWPAAYYPLLHLRFYI